MSRAELVEALDERRLLLSLGWPMRVVDRIWHERIDGPDQRQANNLRDLCDAGEEPTFRVSDIRGYAIIPWSVPPLRWSDDLTPSRQWDPSRWRVK